jgi:predicted DNA-binding transcriptional regulator
MAGKQPINILNEIELDINTNIKTIKYFMKNEKYGD